MRYYLVRSPSEVNPVLWDGVTPYNPPDGWQFLNAEQFAAWRVANPPPPPPPPPVPQTVGSGQIRAAMIAAGYAGNDDALSVLVESILDAIPDPKQRAIAVTLWRNASEFRRDHPFLGAFKAGLGKTDADIDDLFRLAATF
jgi:hypothetical protein